jgi:hypothetical protein
MFLKKRKFFSRKNKDILYHKYMNDYKHFEDLCRNYESKLAQLRCALDENKGKSYIYNWIQQVENEVTLSYEEDICHTYQNKFGSLNLTYTAKDYSDLWTHSIRMTKAVGKIQTTLDLLARLEHDNLTIRKA